MAILHWLEMASAMMKPRHLCATLMWEPVVWMSSTQITVLNALVILKRPVLLDFTLYLEMVSAMTVNCIHKYGICITKDGSFGFEIAQPCTKAN